MDKKVSGKEAMDAINRIFDRCEEIDRTEYKMLPDVLLVEQFIRENSEDWREVPEWMPLPEPYKEEEDGTLD